MKHQVSGNADVIELLAAYLELARENSFGHVAISMVGFPNVIATDYAGEMALEELQSRSFDILRGKLQASIDNWTAPPVDEALDASYVCYNLANGPLGFDFLVWLVDAEMTRRREDAPGPLRVGFWLGRDVERTMSSDQRRMWLEKVFRPALDFVGAIEDSTAVVGRNANVYVTRPICSAAWTGEKVPRFRPRDDDTSHPGAVTITLREATHWVHRNSNLAAWTSFAHYLRRQGENVVIVRDTAHALEPFGDFKTAPEASFDLARRLALYEGAKANLFVGNGPVILAVFGTRPWLQFVTLESENDGYLPNTPSFWAKVQGVEPGDQYPWSSPAQRIVWASDEYENLVAAWEDLRAVL